MANEALVGILYPEEEKKFSKKCDELIDFTKFGDKGWMKWMMKIVEAKDDDFFLAGIKYIDNKFGDKIRPEFKTTARQVALSIINEDLDEFKLYGPLLINQLVDIPKIPEETEALIIAGALRGAVEALEVKLKAKKAASN